MSTSSEEGGRGGESKRKKKGGGDNKPGRQITFKEDTNLQLLFILEKKGGGGGERGKVHRVQGSASIASTPILSRSKEGGKKGRGKDKKKKKKAGNDFVGLPLTFFYKGEGGERGKEKKKKEGKGRRIRKEKPCCLFCRSWMLNPFPSHIPKEEEGKRKKRE